MSTQLTFGDGLVRNDHPDTAHQAAAQAPTGKVCAVVLSYIDARGSLGATDEEILLALSPAFSANTLRPRRVELVRDGRVVDLRQRRKTLAGRWAIVWFAT